MMVPLIYSLRPATDDDYDFLYQLHVATIRPAVEATWGWDDGFQEEYFRSRWDPSNRQIVSVEGMDVGTITLEKHPTAIFLALIEIHPDYQGQGLGTALIRDVISEAHHCGLNVGLHVLKANSKARRLYERLGFMITEEREERYVMTTSLKNAPVYERIYAVVRQIPPGQVATYGQIAAIVGGCTARMVGYAMAALPYDTDVPWQRVINRQGKVSPRTSGHGSLHQRELLEAEGVEFDQQGRVDFEKVGWPGPDWAWLEQHGFHPAPL